MGAANGFPLSGIRVLDLTAMWSGPYCTRLLADMGADVVKVEPSVRPDGLRGSPTLFADLNRNKRSLSLNLRPDTGRALFRRLVGVADVLVENFSPRVMPNFGLAYTELARLNPRLVMLSMPAYGSTGPYRDFIGYGTDMEAMSGIMAMNRPLDPDGLPRNTAIPYGDPTAGIHGTLAVLAAVRRRMKGGDGCHIDLSQRECLVQFIGERMVAQSGGQPSQGDMGHGGAEQGTDHPWGCYPSRDPDRWIALCVRDERDWAALTLAMGAALPGCDIRFRTPDGRRRHREELNQIVTTWTEEQPASELVGRLQSAGLPVSLLARPSAIGESVPFSSLLLPVPPFAPAPDLGADNRAVLQDWLKLTAVEAEVLIREGGFW